MRSIRLESTPRRTNSRRAAARIPSRVVDTAGNRFFGRRPALRHRANAASRAISRRRDGESLAAPRWTPKQFALDILLAALLWAGWGYTSELIKRAIGVVDNHVAPLRPQNTLEVALWIAVSITAGICEEIVFRGYLQRQLGAL